MMEIISVQGLPFLACVIMLGLLSYIGIHVLKREVIFIDIALAQFAAVGAISAHVVFHFHENPVVENGLAFGSTLIAAAFFALVSLVVLRMALAWRREDPFGPGTIRGLRWLGFLFLVQFLARFVAVAVVPESGFSELNFYSAMFDDLGSGDGASLTCAIVFLTLSWVLEYGRKMKEEQALTI